MPRCIYRLARKFASKKSKNDEAPAFARLRRGRRM